VKVTEFAITVVYFVLCLGIALYFRRASKAQSSFWGADRSIGFFVNGVAVLSTLISAASFMGFLGLAYKMGWSFTTVTFGVGSAMGFVLLMLLVSGPLRRYSQIRGKYTLTNFFHDRFGTGSGVVTTIFILILYPVYLVPQLMGGGLAGSYLLGIDFTSAVIAVGAVYVIYVIVGGMLSVTWTDFFQGLLLFFVMIALSIGVAMSFGGFGPLLTKATQVNPFYLAINPKVSPLTYAGMSIGVMTFILASPHIVMRLFTAKNVKAGRAALSLTAGLTLVFHLLGYLGVAAAALIMFPTIANADNTFIEVMNSMWAAPLRGLAVAGIMAAIMSTTGGMLLAIGAEVSTNIYARFMNKDATDKRIVFIGQATMLVVGLVTLVMAINQTQSIGVIVGLVVEGVGSTLLVPMIAGVWWFRANQTGAVLSAVGGFIVFCIVHFMFPIPQFSEILFSLPASVICMVVGSLVTAPPSPKQLKLLEEMHRAGADLD
jgi:sodium/proline symporter